MSDFLNNLNDLAFAYFSVDLDSMRKCVDDLFAEDQRQHKYVISEDQLNLSLVNIGKPLYGAAKSSAVIFAPVIAPGHCVFISNAQDGWYTLINCLCRDLKSPGIKVVTTKDTVEYPANMLHIYEDGKEVRYVRAMLDSDRWDFFEKGAILPFEDPANYRKKRIRDRLNRTIMVDYLKRLGLAIEDENFWRTDLPAIYIREQRLA